MGSKNPKLRGKSGGTKSKDMPKGSPETTAKVMRAAQAVASGGKSEVTRAVKKRLAKAGGGYAEMMRKKKGMGGRMKYMHGGDVKMDGCQPIYNGTPKASAN